MLRLGIRLAAAMIAATGFAAAVLAEVPKITSTGEGSPTGGGPPGAIVDVLDTPSITTPLAARSPLNGIARAGGRLVAVGARGHIVYSDDEGKSWKQASVPVSSDLVAVQFPTARKGWATGHDGVILHSSDGGETWVKQFDGRDAVRVLASSYKDAGDAITEEIAQLIEQGPDKPLLDVWFDDDTTGYVVGAFNFIFRTEDGGVTWVPWLERTDNPKRLHLYAIRRIGEGLFVAGEQGLLLKLDPRRNRFVSLKCEYKGTFFSLAGKPGAIVAFGLRGNAYRSADGGATWQKIDTRVPTTLTGGTVTRDGRIILVTLLGRLLVSSDDGITFSVMASERAGPAAAVAETESGALALVGMQGPWVQAAR